MKIIRLTAAVLMGLLLSNYAWASHEYLCIGKLKISSVENVERVIPLGKNQNYNKFSVSFKYSHVNFAKGFRNDLGNFGCEEMLKKSTLKIDFLTLENSIRDLKKSTTYFFYSCQGDRASGPCGAPYLMTEKAVQKEIKIENSAVKMWLGRAKW